MEVRVYWNRESVPGSDLHGWTAAVVDCLRATSTVASALRSGARSVLPCESESETRALPGAVLAGERDLARIPGFDLGNSPQDFTPERVGGRDIALLTTNGTRAVLQAAAAGARVVTFALVNLGAVADSLAGCERLAIVCAGRQGVFGLDDAFAAGALIDRLPVACADDAGRAALHLYAAGRADPETFLRTSAAGANLARLGYDADVRFCARIDTCPLVPLLVGRELRALV